MEHITDFETRAVNLIPEQLKNTYGGEYLPSPSAHTYLSLDFNEAKIRISNDLISWNVVFSAWEGGAWDIAFGNGIYIAIRGTYYKNYAISSNGTDWVESNFSVEDWTYINSIHFINGKFYVIYKYGGICQFLTSTDGITWELFGNGIPYNSEYPDGVFRFTSFAYGNGIWLVMSRVETLFPDWHEEKRSVIWKSTDDGESWDDVISTLATGLWWWGNADIYYNEKESMFFMNERYQTDSTPCIRKSSNGVDWSICYTTPGEDTAVQSIKWFINNNNNDFMVCVRDFESGYGGYDILISEDGTIWSTYETDLCVYGPSGILYDGNKYILYGNYDNTGHFPGWNTLATSSDGESWTALRPTAIMDNYFTKIVSNK